MTKKINEMTREDFYSAEERNVVIAQGGAFYGAAFFTSDLSMKKLKMEILDLFEKRDILFADDWLSFNADFDTTVMIIPWAGEAQPTPVVLFDSGHADEDMKVLQHLHRQFTLPHMTDGCLESMFTHKKRLNELEHGSVENGNAKEGEAHITKQIKRERGGGSVTKPKK